MRASHHIAAAASIASSLLAGLPGCASQDRGNELTLGSAQQYSPSVSIVLERLAHVEEQLDYFAALRDKYAPLILPTRLLSGKVDGAYSQAITHHQQLADTAEAFRRQITSQGEATQPEVLERANQWCKETSTALSSLYDLIVFAEQNHRPPSGWTAPNGFEYVAVWR